MYTNQINTIWKSTPWIKKAHIQKNKTNQKTYKTYVSSLACDLLRHIMLISPNQIECEVLLDIRHQTLIYLLKFTKTKTKITDKRTVNISTGPMQRKNATKWKINIYRINILFTNSFVTSIEINKQSLPSPEEIFTTIESCHGTMAAPDQLHSNICNVWMHNCETINVHMTCILKLHALLAQMRPLVATSDNYSTSCAQYCDVKHAG